MTAAPEGGEWSAARPGRILPPGKTRYPLCRRLGGAPGPVWKGGKSRPHRGFFFNTSIFITLLLLHSGSQLYPAFYTPGGQNCSHWSVGHYLTVSYTPPLHPHWSFCSCLCHCHFARRSLLLVGVPYAPRSSQLSSDSCDGGCISLTYAVRVYAIGSFGTDCSISR